MALFECSMGVKTQKRYILNKVLNSSNNNYVEYRCSCTHIPNYKKLTVNNFNYVQGDYWGVDLQTSTSSGWQSAGVTVSKTEYDSSSGIYYIGFTQTGGGFWSNGHHILLNNDKITIVCFAG